MKNLIKALLPLGLLFMLASCTQQAPQPENMVQPNRSTANTEASTYSGDPEEEGGCWNSGHNDDNGGT